MRRDTGALPDDNTISARCVVKEQRMVPGRLKSTLDLFATALVIVAAGLFIWTQVESRWLRGRPKPQVADVQNLTIEASAVRYVKGSGPVALVEFTDYECPFCREYTLQTAPIVDTQLVDSGGLRHVIVNFPLEQIHTNARRAGEAAECAGRQGRYWEMHAQLFSDQNNLVPDALKRSVKALALDESSFVRCLSGEASDRITADIREGTGLASERPRYSS
ncbi:MAG: DsbA family protein [Vicinamibacterales bacterium]